MEEIQSNYALQQRARTKYYTPIVYHKRDDERKIVYVIIAHANGRKQENSEQKAEDEE